MRISPINMAYKSLNCKPQKQNNNQKQNISFGTYESPEVKQHHRDLLIKEIDEMGSFFPEKDKARANKRIDYLDKTKAVTIKEKYNIIYATANPEYMKNHEHKKSYESIVDDYKCHHPQSQEEEAIKKVEPNHLEFIRGSKRTKILCEELTKAENGEFEGIPKPKESDESESFNNDYKDNWDRAIELYGRNGY